MSNNPLLSALGDAVPIEEISVDAAISKHEYNALIIDETLFLVCFYRGNEYETILLDASKEDYVMKRSVVEVRECLSCGVEERTGISIVGSGLHDEDDDKNVEFCDSCFSEFKEEIDELIEYNSEKITSELL